MSKQLEKQIFELLLSRYRSDPERVRRLLPEIAQVLDASYGGRRSGKSPFGLTEREREHRQDALRQILQGLVAGSRRERGSRLSREDGIRALEHCAVLIVDDSLPTTVTHDTLVKLLKALLGKAPASVKRAETVPVRDVAAADIINHVSLVRGVVANLDRAMRLVSVSINPRKVKERREMLRFVGVGRDIASDVAERHDEYLTEQSPHAAS